MSSERLFAVVGLVDDDLVEEAESASFRSPANAWRKWGGLAACAALVCSLGFAWLVTGGFSGFGGSSSAPGASGGGGAGHQEGTQFMSYAGPVLPMTVETDADALAVDRDIQYDFSPKTTLDGAATQQGATVLDSYIFTNISAQTVTYNALYPVTSSLQELAEAVPAVSLNGEAVATALYTGPYAGGFTGAEPEDDASYNLSHPQSWTDYQLLLENGSYQQAALTPAQTLDQPVTVYRFDDLHSPTDAYPAATQAISFTIDQTATTVLSYGFNGFSWDDETGWYQFSYFVPNGQTRSLEPKLLVVLGADIGDYELQGYEDGGCENKIDGVSCTITRTTAVLADVIDELYVSFADQMQAQQAALSLLTPEQLRSAAAELLTQYGPLSTNPTDRYRIGQLEDILSEALAVERVVYLSIPMTLAAGESATVQAMLSKAPSFDFACSGSENQGVQGYDLATQVGTNLSFRSITASAVNTDGLELVRQNFGFDWEKGVTEVTLDPSQEHYYLEVRSRV